MNRGLTNRQCGDAYRNGREFENANKTLRGLNCTVGPWDSGRLSGEDLAEFRKVIESRERVYVVFSYATPILWIREDGVEYRVSQRFSVTTSKQAGLFYRLNAVEVQRHFSECVNYETNSLGDCGGRLLQNHRTLVCETCHNR